MAVTELSVEARLSVKSKDPFGEELTGKWIDVAEMKAGVFLIIGNNLTIHRDEIVVASDWDGEVEDLTVGVVCNERMSTHLRWQEVVLDFDITLLHAPSIERLIQALSHVELETWDRSEW